MSKKQKTMWKVVGGITALLVLAGIVVYSTGGESFQGALTPQVTKQEVSTPRVTKIDSDAVTTTKTTTKDLRDYAIDLKDLEDKEDPIIKPMNKELEIMISEQKIEIIYHNNLNDLADGTPVINDISNTEIGINRTNLEEWSNFPSLYFEVRPVGFKEVGIREMKIGTNPQVCQGVYDCGIIDSQWFSDLVKLQGIQPQLAGGDNIHITPIAEHTIPTLSPCDLSAISLSGGTFGQAEIGSNFNNTLVLNGQSQWFGLISYADNEFLKRTYIDKLGTRNDRYDCIQSSFLSYWLSGSRGIAELAPFINDITFETDTGVHYSLLNNPDIVQIVNPQDIEVTTFIK